MENNLMSAAAIVVRLSRHRRSNAQTNIQLPQIILKEKGKLESYFTELLPRTVVLTYKLGFKPTIALITYNYEFCDTTQTMRILFEVDPDIINSTLFTDIEAKLSSIKIGYGKIIVNDSRTTAFLKIPYQKIESLDLIANCFL